MVGCMLESPIGIAAVASFALSKPDVSMLIWIQFTLLPTIISSVEHAFVENTITLSDKPGLGIEGISQGLTQVGVIS